MPVQTGLIPTAHDDLITHATYDFYGTQLATCSLDKRIKVREQDETTGDWVVKDDWKAHDAAVSRLSWAHPEFGSIIASGSFDRTIKVWEVSHTSSHPTSVETASRWVERAVIRDARGTIRGLEFSPSYFGLKFASISTDNYLRVYDCLELPSLNSWLIAEEVDINTLRSRSYSPAPSTIPTITAATGTASSSASVSDETSRHPNQAGRDKEADGGWALSWCKDREWGPVLAVSSDASSSVVIVGLNPARRLTILGPSVGDNLSITSVSWAPSCGRSYQLVATGARDGHVRIYKLTPPNETYYEDLEEIIGETEGKWESTELADFETPATSISAVEWNITGTILSSSGTDGRIRLWTNAGALNGEWKSAGSLGVEATLGNGGDANHDKNAMDE